MKILTTICIAFSFIGFSQNNYYVAKTGNNSDSGSLSSPWETIQYGINQLSAGDTLFIKSGTYEEKLDIDVSGTISAYITIKNFQNDIVILDAINSTNDLSIIWTDNAYLRIEGLHLTNNIINFASGLTLQGSAHHIEIINNKISNIKFSNNPNEPVTADKNAVPLNMYADNATEAMHHITVIGNEVFNNQTGFSENISAGGNFSDFLIENNIVHDNTNIGIDITGNYGISSNSNNDQGRNGIIRGNLVYNCNSPYSTAAGIYIDGGKDIIVENNVCHHNGYGGEIGCEENGSTSNVTFRNNIFYENFYAGMHIGGYDTNTTGVVLNSNVYNNTFYQNDTGNNSNGELNLTKSEHCNIMNNIFYLSSQNVYIATSRLQTNLVLDYNLVFADAGSNVIAIYGDNNNDYDGLQNFYNATGFGAHSSFGNPLFVDTVNNDFHITTNSPAINAGNPNYITDATDIDIDNESRIHQIVDCGADESSFTLNNTSYTINNLSIYPNPTSESINFSTKIINSKYSIFSINGQLILKGKLINSNNIDLSHLDSGIYVLKLTNNSAIEKIVKFVKK